MPPPSILHELARMGQEAGRIAQGARTDLHAELKPDGSVVTNGDRAAEAYLRPQLEQLVPGTTVWGEEFGYEAPGSAGLWVVDPIDGTTNYSFGGLLWGVSVALVKGSDVELGMVFLPDLSEMYVSARGQGAWKDWTELKPIPRGPILDHELVSYDDGLIHGYPNSVLPGKMRCSGAFVVDGTNVATQRFRGMIGRRERLYDIAACVLINQELGADIRYANGRRFGVEELATGGKITEPWIMFPQGSGFSL